MNPSTLPSVIVPYSEYADAKRNRHRSRVPTDKGVCNDVYPYFSYSGRGGPADSFPVSLLPAGAQIKTNSVGSGNNNGNGNSIYPLPLTYHVYDLGTLGGTSSNALAINNKGVIAGWSELFPNSFIRHAFRHVSPYQPIEVMSAGMLNDATDDSGKRAVLFIFDTSFLLFGRSASRGRAGCRDAAHHPDSASPINVRARWDPRRGSPAHWSRCRRDHRGVGRR